MAWIEGNDGICMGPEEVGVERVVGGESAEEAVEEVEAFDGDAPGLGPAEPAGEGEGKSLGGGGGGGEEAGKVPNMCLRECNIIIRRGPGKDELEIRAAHDEVRGIRVELGRWRGWREGDGKEMEMRMWLLAAKRGRARVRWLWNLLLDFGENVKFSA